MARGSAPLVKRAVFWLVLGVWALALAEAMAAGYFLFFSKIYYRPLYLESRNNERLWRTEYHDWGAWHRPSSVAHNSHRCFSVTYTSNSYGARDRERTLRSDAPRAVFLGDSFVEGYGVADRDRLSNLLEERLGYEILNFGSTHFGPLQYEILYRELARRFDHELVIIGFLPANDFIDNDPGFNEKFTWFHKHYRPYYGANGEVLYPASRPPADAAPLAPPSPPLALRLRRLFWLYGLREEMRMQQAILTHPQSAEPAGYFERDPARIQNAMRSILRIQQLAAPRRVLAAFLPDLRSWSYLESHPESYEQSAVAPLVKALGAHGVAAVDLLEAFRERRLDKSSLYLSCDNHWNPAGHRAAFEVLQPILADLLRTPSQVAAGTRPASTAPPSWN